MTYVAILLVMLVAFTVVGWPLISPSRRTQREAAEGSPWDDLISERDAAYQAIKELDFEYQLGNLSEEDYQRLRQRYRSEAAATLRKLDAAVSGGEAGAGGPAAAAQAASLASSPAGVTCPSCGKRLEAGDRFCWSCGAHLGPRCSNCAAPVEEDYKFCPSCGAHMGGE